MRNNKEIKIKMKEKLANKKCNNKKIQINDFRKKK